MQRPIIGIVERPELQTDSVSVTCSYDGNRASILKSGGIPIGILPTQPISYFGKSPVKVGELNIFEKEALETQLQLCDGFLLQGGNTWYEYDAFIIEYALKHQVPLLGICLGMQIAVIEFARSVLGYSDANSGEFNEASTHKVIDFMPDQYGDIPKGGTMRLGAYPCKIKKGSLAEKIYGKEEISERHRHRFEFNNEYRAQIEKGGMVISGTSPDNTLVEMVEIPTNKFFIAGQFHPEFKSRPDHPAPLFKAFIKASIK